MNIGGVPIAAGGYGCIFKPQLRCVEKKPYDENYISKLMYSADAKSEIKTLKKLYKYISKIPNYKSFFIIDSTYVCQPKPLTNKDKKNFNNVCDNIFPKYNKDNINKNIKKFKIINRPDGGIDVESFWGMCFSTLHNQCKSAFINTNNSLLRLLTHGIIPLNNNNYLHLDVKAQNILREGEINTDNVNCRLIDWGLSTEVKNSIPNSVKTRVLQFNLPFSTMLFDIEVNIILSESKTFDPTEIAKKVYYSELSKHGRGHYDYISFIMQLLGKNIDSVIIEHISVILKKYTSKCKNRFYFNQEKYFNNVYRHNVDIWGFLMVYASLLDGNTTSPLTKKVINIIRFCYNKKYAVSRYPIKKIHTLINNLNKNINNKTLKKQHIMKNKTLKYYN